MVDEEAILYNDVLNPQLVADSSALSSSSSSASLYGVNINLTAVERKFRTPKELKEQLAEKEQLRADIIKQLNDLLNQHEENHKTLKGKYLLQIRKLNESLHAKRLKCNCCLRRKRSSKRKRWSWKNVWKMAQPTAG